MATAYRADITVSIRRAGRARARFVKSAIMRDVHKWQKARMMIPAANRFC